MEASWQAPKGALLADLNSKWLRIAKESFAQQALARPAAGSRRFGVPDRPDYGR
jgi:hypothetical protein